MAPNCFLILGPPFFGQKFEKIYISFYVALRLVFKEMYGFFKNNFLRSRWKRTIITNDTFI